MTDLDEFGDDMPSWQERFNALWDALAALQRQQEESQRQHDAFQRQHEANMLALDSKLDAIAVVCKTAFDIVLRHVEDPDAHKDDA